MSHDDPWEHRSAAMRCVTCMWFVIKSPIPVAFGGPAAIGEPSPPMTDAPQEKPPLDRSIGRCRRHSPTMNGYPVVFTDDWCGDHKLNENKTV
jgi:hypothetical protein